IDVDDFEEMDLRWQMAMLTMWARRFLQKTGRNFGANGPTSMGFDMSKMECYNCHKKVHFARKCRSPKDLKRSGSYDWSYQAEEEPTNFALIAFSLNSSFDNEVPSCSKADDFQKSQFDVISYQTGLESVEARLLVYKQNESVFEENIKLLNIEVQLRDTALVTLRHKLEKAEQERDDLKLKLEKFQTSSKNLTDLLASKTNEKTGLGYNLQVPTKWWVSCCSSSIYKNFHATQTRFLVFNTAPTAIETDHLAFNVQLSPTKPTQDLSHTTRPSAPIIEDWVSDSEVESETKVIQFVPGFAQSSEHVKSPRHSDHTIETTIPAATSIPASLMVVAKEGIAKLVLGHHKQYAPLTHSKPQKYKDPTTVLTQFKPVSNTAVKPVSATLPNITVTRLRHAHQVVTKFKSPIRWHTTRIPSSSTSNSPPRVNVVHVLMVSVVYGKQGTWGNPQQALKGKGVIDSGCSRHMTGNVSYLSNFKELNRGYVSFEHSKT
nr:hypothetical protein [Tanacetum cinerariifolium]